MSASLQTVLDAFQRLTPEEQREAAVVILRSVPDLDYSALDDEALAQIADESFQEYDTREAAQNGG